MIVPSGGFSPINSALLQPTAIPLVTLPLDGRVGASGVTPKPGVLNISIVPPKGVGPSEKVGRGVNVSKDVGLDGGVGVTAAAVWVC